MLPGEYQNQPTGQPEGPFRFFYGSNLAQIRPGSPISGPEELLQNIEDWSNEKDNTRYNRGHAPMSLVADRNG